MPIVDLTQPLDHATVMWPGAPPPSAESFETHEDHGSFSRVVSFHEHSGTHLDAPAHFAEGAATVDQLPVEQLVGSLAVVDISAGAARDPDRRLSVEDLEHDEARHGPIEPGSAVAVRTGWGRRHADAAAYLGRDAGGVLHFPGVGPAAAAWLVTRRRIRGLGIDTAGIDPGVDDSYEVHATVTLPNGVWHLEGLANLERLPARGATIFVGVIPLRGGSGAPARVIAVV